MMRLDLRIRMLRHELSQIFLICGFIQIIMVPLQIQGNDRRYTVFNTKSKKLTKVMMN